MLLIYKNKADSRPNERERDLLWRPTGSLIVFSDTEGEVPEQDPDVRQTTWFRHLLPARNSFHGIGKNTTLGAYLIETVNQLFDDCRTRVGEGLQRDNGGRGPHPNILQAQEFLQQKAVRIIGNNAPRLNGEGGNSKTNGNNFHLAILENGIEVYAVPLEILKYVRGQVESIFEIDTLTHPLFDGSREQFRSSIVARTCEVPDHLQRRDPGIIPGQKYPLELAFADHFGNTRIRTDEIGDIGQLLSGVEGQYLELLIGGTQRGRVQVATCLRGVNPGELGIYRNAADGDAQAGPGYVEVVKAWEVKGNDQIRHSAHQALGFPDLGLKVELKRPVVEINTPSSASVSHDQKFSV